MKKCFFVFLLIVTVSFAVNAQNQRPKFSPQRYQEEMEKFIVAESNLTSQEAESFLPLFREMGKKQRVVYQQMRKLGHEKPVSPDQCKNLIIQRDKMDLELKSIQQLYHKKFLEVLSPCKVFNVIKAEERFHRRQLKKWSHDANNKPHGSK